MAYLLRKILLEVVGEDGIVRIEERRKNMLGLPETEWREALLAEVDFMFAGVTKKCEDRFQEMLTAFEQGSKAQAAKLQENTDLTKKIFDSLSGTIAIEDTTKKVGSFLGRTGDNFGRFGVWATKILIAMAIVIFVYKISVGGITAQQATEMFFPKLKGP